MDSFEKFALMEFFQFGINFKFNQVKAFCGSISKANLFPSDLRLRLAVHLIDNLSENQPQKFCSFSAAIKPKGFYSLMR